MNYDLANSSVKQGIQRRTWPFAVFACLFGSAVGGLGSLQLYQFYSRHSGNGVEAYLNQFKEPNVPLCTEAIATLFAGFAVVLSLKFILESISLFNRQIVPANAPGPIDPAQAVRSICGNILTQPDQAPQFADPWLNSIRLIQNRPISLLGFRTIAWDQSTTMGVVPYLLTFFCSQLAKRSMIYLLLLIGLYGVLQIKMEQIIEGVPAPVVQVLEMIRSVPAPWAVGLALVWIGFIAAVVYFLIGSEPQRAEVELQSQELSSPKQPQMIYDLFEDVARILDVNGAPNRLVRHTDSRILGSGVGVSRDFNRQIFIEQQPKLVAAKTQVAGWAAILLGALSVWCAIWTLVSPTWDVEASVPQLFFCGLGALVLLVTGLRFVQIGKLLTFLMRFESLALFVDMRGQVSRSMIVVGAGKDDQVKSENETNRSEMLITYRAARLITEADGIMSTRLLLSMQGDEGVQSGVRELQAALERRVSNGVAIAGIDTSAQSLSEMVNLNLYLKSSNPTPTTPSAMVPRLPSPHLSTGQIETGGVNDESQLNQVIRLRAKATVALKQIAKQDLTTEVENSESTFEEAEALFTAAETYQNEGKYREAIAAYQAVLGLGSLQRN